MTRLMSPLAAGHVASLQPDRCVLDVGTLIIAVEDGDLLIVSGTDDVHHPLREVDRRLGADLDLVVDAESQVPPTM